jgi:sigma-B regulation protein RsbU (phosphoserine phosphatase)
VRILVAEDDAVARRMLRALLSKWGYQVSLCSDGAAAWKMLQATTAPPLAILDWMMPQLDGVEICQKLRALPHGRLTYVILLTARERGEDIVAGLEAGADDYVTKPFNKEELRARLNVGVRMVELQHHLAERVKELEGALARVKYLRGLLPICAYCKKIRNDQNYWQQVETYIAEHSEAQFSHSICPTCYEQWAKPALDRAKLQL